MQLYPVMLNLEKRRVVIIGGGDVALRKARDLLEAGAHVFVIAPGVHQGFKDLAGMYGTSLEMLQRPYQPGDLAGAALVFSATDNGAVNRAVFEEARQLNIFINAVDDPPNCSFFIPSFTKKGALILALSTSGKSPALAARLRRKIEKHIPEDIEQILAALDEIRELLKSDKEYAQLSSSERGRLLTLIVNSDALLHEAAVAAEVAGSLREFLLRLIQAQPKNISSM
jgi:precorrin-2 dehydrogenase / sirohydrochlorin ferrochelatase